MANDEHLAILARGVDAWNHWRKEIPDPEPDLADVDFGHAKLRGIDFAITNLSRTNLAGADLRGANLTSADLKSAVLRRAKLDRAVLMAANLALTDCTAASFNQANLLWAKLRSATLADADLAMANLVEPTFSNTVLDGATVTRRALAGRSSRTLISVEFVRSTKHVTTGHQRLASIPCTGPVAEYPKRSCVGAACRRT